MRGLCVTESTVCEIAAGKQHFLLRTKDGSVYSFGYGFYGSLGHGNTISLTSPKKIADCSRASKIAAAGYLSAAVSSGVLYVWGNAQIKDMPLKIFDIPANVAISDKQGNLYEVDDVALGSSHILVLTPNKELLSLGANKMGVLGRGTKASLAWESEASVILNNIISISSSSNSCAAINGTQIYSFLYLAHFYF